MKTKMEDRIEMEKDILTNKSISVDYLINVFETSRQTILNDLKLLRKRGYNVKKTDLGYYTIRS